ncbi:VOC family protein [Pelagibacterium lacus]|uniref:Glyoxalase n=1 Tax=Pelagibacterium lacus TaxID=2282655 RepID=A0A369W376_9HYPH|nr:VOC family protein [Pelagibacterium lacus]RDE07810.1 glyoxalase [Pelagibacterium lacus]
MERIVRVVHAVIETPDVVPEVEHYSEMLGLNVTIKDGDTTFLSTGLDHHNVVIRRGSAIRCATLGFQVSGPEDLDAFARRLSAAGVASQRKSDAQPGISDLLSFQDDCGTTIELFSSSGFSTAGFGRAGVVPNKLGHLAFHTPDIQRTVSFYRDMLGFREADWMADFFAFMRCGPDHHTVNFIQAEKPNMHHIAFELRDASHLNQACDIVVRQGKEVVWGPVRHGIGHNIAMYYRGPNGQMVELFCELDRMQDESLGFYEPRPWHEDFPQRPKVWHDIDRAAYHWGRNVPPGFATKPED